MDFKICKLAKLLEDNPAHFGVRDGFKKGEGVWGLGGGLDGSWEEGGERGQGVLVGVENIFINAMC